MDVLSQLLAIASALLVPDVAVASFNVIGLPVAITTAVHVLSAATLGLALRAVGAMRGFDRLAQYVDVFVGSLVDMVPLLLIISVVVLAAGFVFYLQFTDAVRTQRAELGTNSFGQDVAEVGTAMAAAYKVGLFADFDTGAFGYASAPEFVWALFVAFTVGLVIVGLNVLIAVLGDTFDRVVEAKAASRNRQRAQLILEYLRALPSLLHTRVVRESVWVHRLVPWTELEETDGGRAAVRDAADDDWPGRVAAIKRVVRESHRHLVAALARLERRVEAVGRPAGDSA